MSNSPMRGVAGNPAGACNMDWSAEIQRKRDALRSYLAVLEEARRRLEEIQHDDAGGELVPGAGVTATAGFSDIDTAGDDDFYPLDDDEDDELGEGRCPMQWEDQVCRQMVYNNSSRHLRQDDDDLVRHLAVDSDDLDLDPDNNDDGDEISQDLHALDLHVPHIETGTATPPSIAPGEEEAVRRRRRGFGAVPASAATIAGLKRHRYDGSSGGDSTCVIPADWSAEIQLKRDALRSYLAVVEVARRRLEEIQHDDNAGSQLVPGAGGIAAAADEYSDTAGGDDDFYPLDDDDDKLGDERPMQWQDQVCHQMIYNDQHLQQADDDLVGHLADSDNHDLDLDDDYDTGDEISRDIVARGLHVPHIETGTATPPPFVPGEEAARRRRGFGAVPASAAAIAGLKRHRYDGSSGGDSMCVICMRDYKKGKRLRVMPCTYKHRFHGRCIREWLSWSNLCPLCRHALPTAAEAEQGGGGVHNSRSTIVRVRVNVNPY